MPGMETTTRMAPRKKERSGWMSAPQLFLPNYACHWSRGYAPCLRQTTTEEWQKPLGFNRSGVSQHNRNVSFYVHIYIAEGAHHQQLTRLECTYEISFASEWFAT